VNTKSADRDVLKALRVLHGHGVELDKREEDIQVRFNSSVLDVDGVVNRKVSCGGWCVDCVYYFHFIQTQMNSQQWLAHYTSDSELLEIFHGPYETEAQGFSAVNNMRTTISQQKRPFM
jgi:hypothetical protein